MYTASLQDDLRGVDYKMPVREARIAGLCYLLLIAGVRRAVRPRGGVILYRLFRPVHSTIALLALVFAVAPVAIEALLLPGILLSPFIGEFSLALWLMIKVVSATNGRTP